MTIFANCATVKDVVDKLNSGNVPNDWDNQVGNFLSRYSVDAITNDKLTDEIYAVNQLSRICLENVSNNENNPQYIGIRSQIGPIQTSIGCRITNYYNLMRASGQIPNLNS